MSDSKNRLPTEARSAEVEQFLDKLKKAPPGSAGGTVTDPDKMVKVQVASDIK